jgi:hypothetical protein
MTYLSESSHLSKWSLALTLLSLLFAVVPTSAQVVDRVGLKGGLVSASASGNLGPLDLKRRTGWSATLFAERDLLPFLALVGEVGYAQGGFVETMEERAPDGTVEQTVRANTRLDYLTIPVLAKLEYDFRTMRLYALAGPRLDVLIGREAGVFEYQSAPIDESESEVVSAYTSPVLGATVGVGVSTSDVLPVHLLVEARWAPDVTESFETEMFVDAPRDVRNNAAVVMIGVGF